MDTLIHVVSILSDPDLTESFLETKRGYIVKETYTTEVTYIECMETALMVIINTKICRSINLIFLPRRNITSRCSKNPKTIPQLMLITYEIFSHR